MRRIFWRALYPHAVLAAPLFLIFNYEYFAPDRDLIAAAGRATDLRHIREEVREFFWDSNNKGWLRRRLFIRVSGQRLKNLARRYLPEDGASASPQGSTPPASRG